MSTQASLRPYLSHGVLLAAGLMASVMAGEEIRFAGHTWRVRSGQGGPGPNTWDTRNVWLDSATNLHLKIAHRDGVWSCAEVTLPQRLGFGRYQFQTIGRLDKLDDHVVLGLFNYPTGDVGPDATHEIDIEFARWGNARNPMGNFTVWPAESGLKQVSQVFPFVLSGDASTHWFQWTSNRIEFQSANGHRDDADDPLGSWTYSPPEPARWISRQPMPVHLNLWLFQGRPPKNGQEVEIVIRNFQYTPEKPARLDRSPEP